jgi:FkbM family methyltransferase
MKKIIFIAPHLSTGGMPQYLTKQIEEVIKEYEVYVIEWSDITGGLYVVQKNKIRNMIGNRLITLDHDKFNIINIIDDIKADIIHFHEIPHTFVENTLLNKLYNEDRTYNIVVTTHSSTTVPESIEYTADKYVLVSEWSKDIFENYFKNEIPLDIWEYPIENYQFDKLEAKKELNLDPSYKHVLNVGLFTRGKNQGELFELAKTFLNEKVLFHFVGNQAINFKDYWGDIMVKKPSNCIIHGERSDVDLFYKACDVFYFTSNFELNPLAVKEALSFGLPTFIKKLHTFKNSYDGKVTYISSDINKNREQLVNALGGVETKSYFSGFDWGNEEPHLNFKETMIKEFVIDKIYEKKFSVEEGDIVVDIGASIGPFAYSILEKNPKHIYCLEPSDMEFNTLLKNTNGKQVTCIKKGISKYDDQELESEYIFGHEMQTMQTITLQRLMDDYNLDRIDFLKIDCEGGEYDIFSFENEDLIFEKISKISGEFHLGTTLMKQKFKEFRNTYLTQFENFDVYSVDGVDIKWDLWNDHFIEYYTEVIIHIDNRNEKNGNL